MHWDKKLKTEAFELKGTQKNSEVFCSVGVLIFLVNNVEKHVIVKNTIISMEYAMYINFIVEFIVTVVSSITLYNIFRYTGSKFWSDWHKKMCQFRIPFRLALLIWKMIKINIKKMITKKRKAALFVLFIYQTS